MRTGQGGQQQQGRRRQPQLFFMSEAKQTPAEQLALLSCASGVQF